MTAAPADARERDTITDSGAGAAAEGPRVYTLRSPRSREAVLAALSSAVGEWGGEWTARENGGELKLPVHAGLRRGLLHGETIGRASAHGSEIELVVRSTSWWLDRSAVMLLLLAALSALAVVLWPFFPALAKWAPIGLVLGASVWLVILARLRHEGPIELMREVEAALDDGAQPKEPPTPIAPR